MQTVLFVCTGNYYRSRYAEMLFNATKPASLPWFTHSRGFNPSPITQIMHRKPQNIWSNHDVENALHRHHAHFNHRMRNAAGTTARKPISHECPTRFRHD